MASKSTKLLEITGQTKWANAAKKATRVAAWAKIMTKVVITKNQGKSPP